MEVQECGTWHLKLHFIILWQLKLYERLIMLYSTKVALLHQILFMTLTYTIPIGF